MKICTEVFIVLLLVVISSCSFHQIEDKIASYTVAQFLYTHIHRIAGAAAPRIQQKYNQIYVKLYDKFVLA